MAQIQERVRVIVDGVTRLASEVVGNTWPPHSHAVHSGLEADDHLQYMLCSAGVDRPFTGDVYLDAGVDLRGESALQFDDHYRYLFTAAEPTKWTLDHIKLSADQGEWSAFYARFGIRSIIGSIIDAHDNGETLHSELTDLATAQEDHPYYLLLDGTRPMGGTLDLDNNDTIGFRTATFDHWSPATVDGTELTVDLTDANHIYAEIDVSIDSVVFVAPNGGGNFFLEIVNTDEANITISGWPASIYWGGSEDPDDEPIEIEPDAWVWIAFNYEEATETRAACYRAVVTRRPEDYDPAVPPPSGEYSAGLGISISEFNVITNTGVRTIGKDSAQGGAIVFQGTGVSQGTGGDVKVFTFTDTQYEASDFSHGDLADLDADDHDGPTYAYILASGTRDFTGDQSMGGNSLTGIDSLDGAVSGNYQSTIDLGAPGILIAAVDNTEYLNQTMSIDIDPVDQTYDLTYSIEGSGTVFHLGYSLVPDAEGSELLSDQDLSIISEQSLVLNGFGINFGDANLDAAESWVNPIAFSDETSWDELYELCGETEVSLQRAILLAAEHAIGLDAQYRADPDNRGITIDLGYLGMTIPDTEGLSGNILALTNLKTDNDSALIQFQNDCVWNADAVGGAVEPRLLYISGDAGLGEDGEREAYAYGHFIESDGYFTIKRTNESGFYSLLSLTEGTISNPDNHRAVARIASYAEDDIDGGHTVWAYIDCVGRGVNPESSAGAAINAFADSEIDIYGTSALYLGSDGDLELSLGGDLMAGNARITDIANASFGPDCDETSVSPGTVAVDWSTGAPSLHTTSGSNITEVEFTRPVGHGAGLVWTVLATADITVTNFIDSVTESTFIFWEGDTDFNPDAAPVTIHDGMLGIFAFRYQQTDGALICIGSFREAAQG